MLSQVPIQNTACYKGLVQCNTDQDIHYSLTGITTLLQYTVYCNVHEQCNIML